MDSLDMPSSGSKQRDAKKPRTFLSSDTGAPSRGEEVSNPSSAHRTEQAQLMSYFRDLELKQRQLKEIETFEASSRPLASADRPPASAEERFPTIEDFEADPRHNPPVRDTNPFHNIPESQTRQLFIGINPFHPGTNPFRPEQRIQQDTPESENHLVLKESLKHQAEEDFRQLMDSPDARKLEQILNDRIKDEIIKDAIRNFVEFIPRSKALNAIYESIGDYYDCKGKFQRGEANLPFAQQVRAKITEGYWRVAVLRGNEQFPQGRLRDFADEQVKRLGEAIDKSKGEYNRISKTEGAKNQVELEYLKTWIKQMEGVRTSINERAIVFKDSSQTFFKDASNLTLAELKTSLKGFLWELKTSLKGSPRDQLDPRRSDAAAFNKAHFPTPAPRDETVVDTYHGYEVPDPYRPLENLKDERTSQYMKEEHQERFLEYIAPVEGQDELTAYWKDIWDYPTESIPNRYGDTYFSRYDDGKSSQSVYRIRDTLEGEPRTLIDPNDRKDSVFSLEGTLLGDADPSPDGKWVAYMTSKGGGAEGTIHIRNVATGRDLPYVIEKCNSAEGGMVSWDRDSKGFQYRYPASDDLKHHVLKHFGLDTPKQNPTVFELEQDEVFLGGYYLHDQSGEDGAYDFVETYVDTRYAIYIKQHGSDKSYDQLFADDQSIGLEPVAEVNGKIYAVTNLEAPRKRLVAIDPNNPQPEHWEEILRPEGQDLMKWAKVHQGHLIIRYAHNIADQIALYSMDGKTLQSKVPLPEQSTVSCGRLNKEDTTLLLDISGYRSPGDKYKYHIDEGRLELWKRSEAKVDLRDAIIERIDVPFRDNKGDDIQIPMTVIRSQNTKLDGTAALKLVGYGGFNSLHGVPCFILDACAWTKKKGGIYAYINNLPGDGLSGSEGWDRGRLHNKKNVFDAYCACAEELVRKKYTSSERLIAEGGSNGGLTVLASVLKRSERIGAVVADVPLADIYRYTEHTPYWKTDLGNPKESKEDFEATSEYDILRNIHEGEDYPPILIKTSMDDPIVHPLHSSKFLATFHEKASPESLCVMRVNLDTGHRRLPTTEQFISDRVETYAFLERAIGPINQDEYKESKGIS